MSRKGKEFILLFINFIKQYLKFLQRKNHAGYLYRVVFVMVDLGV